MVTQTSSALNSTAPSFTFNAPTSSVSTDSFTQELAAALESAIQQSGGSGQFDISIKPTQGQNSDGSQFVVTVTAPQAAATPTTASTASELMGATSSTAKASASPLSSQSTSSTKTAAVDSTSGTGSTSPSDDGPSLLPTVPDGGASAPGFQNAMQQFENDWSVLNPQQVAFQLANAAGTGGGVPTDMVPGTTIAFGDLTQTQQFAYQYAANYGTAGDSLQDFLLQNAGPQTAWNLSYNQIQQNTDIQAAADSSYQVLPGGTPSDFQAQSDPPTVAGNISNLPNPAMIQYLPADQQAAAEAAIAAEGPYGQNIAAALQVYASS